MRYLEASRPFPMPHQASHDGEAREESAPRSRSVSDQVLHSRLTLPEVPARVRLDWQREVSRHLQLEAGQVEVMPLARTQARWPQYRQCVQAASDWTRGLGLNNLLKESDMALMACRGAGLHHDGGQYGAFAFCNLFLSEDCGLDLHFVATGMRIALGRGTVVLFDTYQPHTVLVRDRARFEASDFSGERDLTQVFLTWELPIGHPQLAHVLGIEWDGRATSVASPPPARP